VLSPRLICQPSLTGLEISVIRFPGDESSGYYHLVPLGRADQNVKLTPMFLQGPNHFCDSTSPWVSPTAIIVSSLRDDANVGCGAEANRIARERPRRMRFSVVTASCGTGMGAN
jgi:hypothetical protein